MAIEKLKSHRSPGTDSIPLQLIKAGGRTICSEIHKLITSIWNIEELPKQWKKSITVPVYKKGDKTVWSNYRGISLFLTICKILSHILLSRLTPHAEDIIGDHHCGFWRNTSTTDHIFCNHQILKKNGNTMRLCISYLQTSRKPMIQLGKRFCIIFLLSLASLWN